MQWEARNGMAEWLEINFVGTTDWLALPRGLAFLGNVMSGVGYHYASCPEINGQGGILVRHPYLYPASA